jgi:hypothetical protein
VFSLNWISLGHFLHNQYNLKQLYFGTASSLEQKKLICKHKRYFEVCSDVSEMKTESKNCSPP